MVFGRPACSHPQSRLYTQLFTRLCHLQGFVHWSHWHTGFPRLCFSLAACHALYTLARHFRALRRLHTSGAVRSFAASYLLEPCSQLTLRCCRSFRSFSAALIAAVPLTPWPLGSLYLCSLRFAARSAQLSSLYFVSSELSLAFTHDPFFSHRTPFLYTRDPSLAVLRLLVCLSLAPVSCLSIALTSQQDFPIVSFTCSTSSLSTSQTRCSFNSSVHGLTSGTAHRQ